MHTFLEELATQLAPLRDADLTRYVELLSQDDPTQQATDASDAAGTSGASDASGAPPGTLAVCDVTRAQTLLTEKYYSVDAKALREYFPLEHVLSILFDISQVDIQIIFLSVHSFLSSSGALNGVAWALPGFWFGGNTFGGRPRGGSGRNFQKFKHFRP